MKPVFALAFLVLLAACTLTGNIIKEKEPFHIEVYFCPKTDCMKEFSMLVLNSTSADCALYNVDEEMVKSAIRNNVSLRIAADKSTKLDYSFVRKVNKTGLMHNKFCIFNNKTVMTGSFNPVKGSYNDNNNIVVIKSGKIANNYLEEFYELWNGKENIPAKNSAVIFENFTVENYFCPDDGCAERVENLIENANESIYFMAYSFTHKGIANSLIIKKSEGLDVKGVIEKNNLKGSVYDVLIKNNAEVKSDKNKALMHHKVFIIDKRIVITGSFNPTKSGDERNDENILVIHNPDVAALFLNEFSEIYGI